MLLQNVDSTGNYINDFSNISIITYNISTIFNYIYRNSKYINDSTRNIGLPTKTSIPFLYKKRLSQMAQPFSLFLNRHNNPIHIVTGNFILLVCWNVHFRILRNFIIETVYFLPSTSVETSFSSFKNSKYSSSVKFFLHNCAMR